MYKKYLNNETMRTTGSSRIRKTIYRNSGHFLVVWEDTMKVWKFDMDNYSYFEINTSLF